MALAALKLTFHSFSEMGVQTEASIRWIFSDSGKAMVEVVVVERMGALPVCVETVASYTGGSRGPTGTDGCRRW